MAKLYGEIAAKALLTLDKSFARANGQPLDASEVYYSKAAAEEYAATAQAYIGQKIVVIENGVVTHYSVEDTAGTLKELGSKPVADGTTVAIGEDGKITLANIAEANKTGTYNAVLVNGALTWVKPSETTVEGLSDLIQALTGRVDTAEADIDALQASVGVASKAAVGEEGSEGYEPAVVATGLHKAVEDEVARAKAAEEALGERIDGIDFVDDKELSDAIAAARTEISKEIDDDVKVAKDRADEAYTLAESKVDATTYATDKKNIEDEASAIREIAEGARDSLNTFLTSEDIDETVNTLKEIQTEIEKMTDATELATALASKADVTYVNEELGKKQDVIPENTYDAYGAAATAKSEAIEAAATAAAGIYATQTAVSELETAIDERLDVLEAYEHNTYATKTELSEHETAADAKYATKTELSEHETAADAKYATKDELTPVKQTADNAKTAVSNLETRFDEIVAVGGEPNAINKIQVNGSELAITEKTVNITVPTKVSDLTDDTGFDARITAAQNQADKGVSDASAAQSAADKAQGEVDALEEVVGGIQTTVAGHTTSIGDHATRIGALEQADIAHKTEYESLNAIVSGHTEAIAKKAEQTALDSALAKTSANETAIKTLNETTIPGINTEIAKKANADNVYTKKEVDDKVGDIGDKTIIELINEAKSDATYDDTQIKADIKANTDALAILNGTVDTAGSVAKVAKDTAKAEVATVIGAAPEAMDTLEEVANWIANDESGAAAMAADIAKNKDDIAAILNAETGILATAKAYTDAQILAIPVANVEDKLGLAKADGTSIESTAGTFSVKAVSTDLLVQGANELILNGGTAV